MSILKQWSTRVTKRISGVYANSCGGRGIDSLEACAALPPRALRHIRASLQRCLRETKPKPSTFSSFSMRTQLKVACTCVYARARVLSMHIITLQRRVHVCTSCTHPSDRAHPHGCFDEHTRQIYFPETYARFRCSCFRRSELLGCMTLPLPLSQDKVNTRNFLLNPA